MFLWKVYCFLTSLLFLISYSCEASTYLPFNNILVDPIEYRIKISKISFIFSDQSSFEYELKRDYQNIAPQKTIQLNGVMKKVMKKASKEMNELCAIDLYFDRIVQIKASASLPKNNAPVRTSSQSLALVSFLGVNHLCIVRNDTQEAELQNCMIPSSDSISHMLASLAIYEEEDSIRLHFPLSFEDEPRMIKIKFNTEQRVEFGDLNQKAPYFILPHCPEIKILAEFNRKHHTSELTFPNKSIN